MDNAVDTISMIQKRPFMNSQGFALLTFVPFLLLCEKCVDRLFRVVLNKSFLSMVEPPRNSSNPGSLSHTRSGQAMRVRQGNLPTSLKHFCISIIRSNWTCYFPRKSCFAYNFSSSTACLSDGDRSMDNHL